MAFRWIYTEPAHQGSVLELHRNLGVSEKVARLLALRNIHTSREALNFFTPEMGHLHDPFLMKDMKQASLRLSRAICRSETVLIYGDYDVDGTTATSALILFLREFGVEAHYYIPHRFKDGCGIGPDGVKHAARLGADLIVTVDCGISAFDAADLARKIGIDMIVCDHHTAGDELPDALAVLNPKRRDCSYPFDGLSGAGVGYKLIQATVRQLGLGGELAWRYLDLVAISIASDIVPVVDENRVILSKGLEMINSSPRPGIRSLLKQIRAEKGGITTSTLIYSIGPRINAAGRMGDASVAVNLMISDSEELSDRCAAELETINLERRSTDSRTMEEAVRKVDREISLNNLWSMVLHEPDWHLGVIGIVASRLVDLYYRPVILLSSVEGKIKGSARSVKGFNIYEALKECEDLLVQFGGHEYAAGLTMELKNLSEFRRRINEIACLNLSENDFKPELMVDVQLDLSEVDGTLWQSLKRFRPFGPGNLKPVFVSREVEVFGDPTIVGNGHLKLRLKQNGSGVFEAIGFNMHEYMPLVRDSGRKRIDIAYEVEENHRNYRDGLQLRLRDIHLGKPGNGTAVPG